MNPKAKLGFVIVESRRNSENVAYFFFGILCSYICNRSIIIKKQTIENGLAAK